MAERLPLFPLGQPLFPGITLNLQIFEQRYLRLVRQALREDSAFGIVAIREGREVGAVPEIFGLGLEVRIKDWCQQENGLLGIAVSGERRFRVLTSTAEEDGLLIGEVEWLEGEAAVESFPQEIRDGLERLLRDLAQHPALDWVELSEAMSLQELSWKLAQLLPMSADRKVPLLGEPDPAKRLTVLQTCVDELSGL